LVKGQGYDRTNNHKMYKGKVMAEQTKLY